MNVFSVITVTVGALSSRRAKERMFPDRVTLAGISWTNFSASANEEITSSYKATRSTVYVGIGVEDASQRHLKSCPIGRFGSRELFCPIWIECSHCDTSNAGLPRRRISTFEIDPVPTTV